MIISESTKQRTERKEDKMAEERKYTAEQLSDAERVAKALASIPEKKRTLVVMMTNSFMAGMEAQKAIDDTTKATA